MNGFARHVPSGAVIANFTGFEADLIRNLAGQVVELLHSEAAAPVEPTDPLEAMFNFDGPTTEPDDPALQRLLPNGYSNDPEASGEFRRFTESTLREAKSGNAMVLVTSLEEAGLTDEPDDLAVIDVELDAQQALAWMKAFTDIRLALAARLGVREDDEEFWASLPDEDPRSSAHDIYEWVGWLQETLVEAVSAR